MNAQMKLDETLVNEAKLAATVNGISTNEEEKLWGVLSVDGRKALIESSTFGSGQYHDVVQPAPLSTGRAWRWNGVNWLLAPEMLKPERTGECLRLFDGADASKYVSVIHGRDGYTVVA